MFPVLTFSQINFNELEFRGCNVVYIKNDTIPFTGKCKGVINFLTNHNFIEDMLTVLFKYHELLVFGQYKNGKPEGRWLYYRIIDEDTVLFCKQKFVKGILNGKMKTYYPNGKLAEKGYYRNGKLNGRYISKDSNGKFIFKGRYKDDKFNGLLFKWDENGKILTKLLFKNGDVVKRYTPIRGIGINGVY